MTRPPFFKKREIINWSNQNFWSIKINNAKSETAGISVKKGVKMALYGMECLNLTEDIITILGIYYSCNYKIEHEKNFLDHLVQI